MTAIRLADYDLGELKGLLFEIEQEIKGRRKSEVSEARRKIASIAQDAGLPLDGLLDGKAAAAVRYRNPDDAAQTWSGRGRQPKWVAQALAAGRSLAEFTVADAG